MSEGGQAVYGLSSLNTLAVITGFLISSPASIANPDPESVAGNWLIMVFVMVFVGDVLHNKTIGLLTAFERQHHKTNCFLNIVQRTRNKTYVLSRCRGENTIRPMAFQLFRVLDQTMP